MHFLDSDNLLCSATQSHLSEENTPSPTLTWFPLALNAHSLPMSDATPSSHFFPVQDHFDPTTGITCLSLIRSFFWPKNSFLPWAPWSSSCCAPSPLAQRGSGPTPCTSTRRGRPPLGWTSGSAAGCINCSATPEKFQHEGKFNAKRKGWRV